MCKVLKISRTSVYYEAKLDNAVAEATYKVLKTEFTNQMHFDDLAQLELELFDYINWYNNIRFHGSLGYKTPASYKRIHFS